MDIKGISWGYIENILGIYWKYLENIFCEIFRIFSGYLGEIWWISWEYMGVSWVYLVYTWKISGENLRGIWGMLMGWFGDYVYH